MESVEESRTETHKCRVKRRKGLRRSYVPTRMVLRFQLGEIELIQKRGRRSTVLTGYMKEEDTVSRSEVEDFVKNPTGPNKFIILKSRSKKKKPEKIKVQVENQAERKKLLDLCFQWKYWNNKEEMKRYEERRAQEIDEEKNAVATNKRQDKPQSDGALGADSDSKEKENNTPAQTESTKRQAEPRLPREISRPVNESEEHPGSRETEIVEREEDKHVGNKDDNPSGPARSSKQQVESGGDDGGVSGQDGDAGDEDGREKSGLRRYSTVLAETAKEKSIILCVKLSEFDPSLLSYPTNVQPRFTLNFIGVNFDDPEKKKKVYKKCEYSKATSKYVWKDVAVPYKVIKRLSDDNKSLWLRWDDIDDEKAKKVSAHVKSTKIFKLIEKKETITIPLQINSKEGQKTKKVQVGNCIVVFESAKVVEEVRQPNNLSPIKEVADANDLGKINEAKLQEKDRRQKVNEEILQISEARKRRKSEEEKKKRRREEMKKKEKEENEVVEHLEASRIDTRRRLEEQLVKEAEVFKEERKSEVLPDPKDARDITAIESESQERDQKREWTKLRERQLQEPRGIERTVSTPLSRNLRTSQPKPLGRSMTQKNEMDEKDTRLYDYIDNAPIDNNPKDETVFENAGENEIKEPLNLNNKPADGIAELVTNNSTFNPDAGHSDTVIDDGGVDIKDVLVPAGIEKIPEDKVDEEEITELPKAKPAHPAVMAKIPEDQMDEKEITELPLAQPSPLIRPIPVEPRSKVPKPVQKTGRFDSSVEYEIVGELKDTCYYLSTDGKRVLLTQWREAGGYQKWRITGQDGDVYAVAPYDESEELVFGADTKGRLKLEPDRFDGSGLQRWMIKGANPKNCRLELAVKLNRFKGDSGLLAVSEDNGGEKLIFTTEDMVDPHTENIEWQVAPYGSKAASLRRRRAFVDRLGEAVKLFGDEIASKIDYMSQIEVANKDLRERIRNIKEWELKLTILRGTNLAPKDPTGTSDPYVKVRAYRQGNEHKIYFNDGSKHPEHLKKRTLNPRWEYTLQDFPQECKNRFTRLEIECWDKDKYSWSDDFMGIHVLTRSDILNAIENEEDKGELGTCTLKLDLHPRPWQKKSKYEQEKDVRGYITVKVEHHAPNRYFVGEVLGAKQPHGVEAQIVEESQGPGDEAVVAQVVDSSASPKSYPEEWTLVGEEVKYHDEGKRWRLRIHVRGAVDLAPAKSHGFTKRNILKRAPYLKTKLFSGKHRLYAHDGSKIHKAKNTLDPVWNYTLDSFPDGAADQFTVVRFECHDAFNGDCLGYCDVSRSEIGTKIEEGERKGGTPGQASFEFKLKPRPWKRKKDSAQGRLLITVEMFYLTDTSNFVQGIIRNPLANTTGVTSRESINANVESVRFHEHSKAHGKPSDIIIGILAVIDNAAETRAASIVVKQEGPSGDGSDDRVILKTPMSPVKTFTLPDANGKDVESKQLEWELKIPTSSLRLWRPLLLEILSAGGEDLLDSVEIDSVFTIRTNEGFSTQEGTYLKFKRADFPLGWPIVEYRLPKIENEQLAEIEASLSVTVIEGLNMLPLSSDRRSYVKAYVVKPLEFNHIELFGTNSRSKVYETIDTRSSNGINPKYRQEIWDDWGQEIRSGDFLVFEVWMVGEVDIVTGYTVVNLTPPSSEVGLCDGQSLDTFLPLYPPEYDEQNKHGIIPDTARMTNRWLVKAFKDMAQGSKIPKGLYPCGFLHVSLKFTSIETARANLALNFEIITDATLRGYPNRVLTEGDCKLSLSEEKGWILYDFGTRNQGEDDHDHHRLSVGVDDILAVEPRRNGFDIVFAESTLEVFPKMSAEHKDTWYKWLLVLQCLREKATNIKESNGKTLLHQNRKPINQVRKILQTVKKQKAQMQQLTHLVLSKRNELDKVHERNERIKFDAEVEKAADQAFMNLLERTRNEGQYDRQRSYPIPEVNVTLLSDGLEEPEDAYGYDHHCNTFERYLDEILNENAQLELVAEEAHSIL